MTFPNFSTGDLVKNKMDWFFAGGIAAAVVVLPVVVALTVKLYIRCTLGRCKSTNRLDGKTVIVTGSTSGIGKKTAMILAGRGAKVIMACRNVKKAEEVAANIREKCPDCVVIVKSLDLCKLSTVRKFADDVSKTEEKIDILVNNAGMTAGNFKLTEDGFEECYQANYLGPFYLTELLMPLLKKSTSGARIVNTGSSAYFLGRVNPQKFLCEIKNNRILTMFRYGDTKLAMLMWTRAMAEELEGSGITINFVHPGVVATAIASHASSFSNFVFQANIFMYGRTAEEGAQTLLHLCLDPEGAVQSGHYWSDCKIRRTVKGNDATKNRALVEVTRECLREQR